LNCVTGTLENVELLCTRGKKKKAKGGDLERHKYYDARTKLTPLQTWEGSSARSDKEPDGENRGKSGRAVEKKRPLIRWSFRGEKMYVGNLSVLLDSLDGRDKKCSMGRLWNEGRCSPAESPSGTNLPTSNEVFRKGVGGGTAADHPLVRRGGKTTASKTEEPRCDVVKIRAPNFWLNEGGGTGDHRDTGERNKSPLIVEKRRGAVATPLLGCEATLAWLILSSIKGAG